MRMLLCAAVAVAAALPSTAAAEAGDWSGANSAFTGTTQFVDSNRSGVRLFNDHGRRGDRRGRRNGSVVVGDFGYYGGDWALNNNRSFESDSYNDWWHDRPDRAYPRWMSQNQDCQRQYWTGAGWRC
jgi:opacity protein-like surface antigen